MTTQGPYFRFKPLAEAKKRKGKINNITNKIYSKSLLFVVGWVLLVRVFSLGRFDS